MDEVTAESAVLWCESIEEQLVSFIKKIPPIGANMNTWSPVLASIIVDACGLMDSIFRYFAPQSYVTKKGISKDRDRLSLHDFADMYCSEFGLHEQKIILLTTPPVYKAPFSDWLKMMQGGDFATPNWWGTYNNFKHSRLEYLQEAKLETAICALAGLILTITSFKKEFAHAMIRRGWIDIKGWVPDVAIEMLKNERNPEEFVVETTLFVVVLGKMKLPEKVEDIAPALHGGSKKLAVHIGKWS